MKHIACLSAIIILPFLPGCMTSDERLRDTAYAACEGETGEALNTCMTKRLAELSEDRDAYNKSFHQRLEACEEETAIQVARGVPADRVTCRAGLSDYQAESKKKDPADSYRIPLRDN